MSDDIIDKTKEEIQAELQARLDSYFAEKGITGANFAESGRRRFQVPDTMSCDGVKYTFALGPGDSYICTGSEHND